MGVVAPPQSRMPAARLLALLPSPPPRGMHLAARLASAAGAAAVAADALQGGFEYNDDQIV